MSLYGQFQRWLRCKSVFVVLLHLILPTLLFAQEDVKVSGGFLSDSLKIGEQTAYYLVARYPSTLTVLFPDSTHSFAPFEYQNKEYFMTQTTDGISADSAVYFLTTFEVDRKQYLSMPVYVVRTQDSTVFQTTADSVLITQLVTQVPDTVGVAQLPLKMNTAYQKVFYNFNFWMMMLILGALLITAVVVWILFGKKIKRYFRARRLQKNHLQFLDRYNALVGQLKTTFSTPATESALAAWKKYMEQLESRPYTKLTTRETLGLIREPALREPLSRIDRAIYGHDTTVVDSLENLKMFADQQFKRKMKEVQHG
ncbi:MAG: hypothetical protein WA874_04970 [Chryseosolibacter sp.]